MDGVRYTRTTFASLADGVIVCHIKASRKGALNIDVTLDSPFEHQTQKTPSGVMLKVKGQDQEGIKAALTAECVADVRTDGTEATIIVSAATNFVNYHDVSGNAAQRNADYINKVKLMSYAQLEKRHVEAYQKQFATSSLILPTDINASLPTNQRLEKFAGSKDMAMVALMYNYGRYLLISSSQPGGQAANLQGVWNNSKNAPWDSKYTININTEMNYWPAEVTNLGNTTEPLYSLIKDLSVTGAQTAREMYGCRGWMAHHNTDIWRIAGPVDGAQWGMFPNGGAWLTTHLWQHYLYTGNNLKGVDVDFPLGKLIVVTGVSGSGKSTLINETLQPILSQHFYRSLKKPMPYESIEGIENIDKVVNVDQSPIGRTPRSNPATYTGVFSDIRSLFVGLPEAKIRGYKPGRFSFNVKGGRCEECKGNGYKTIEMNFLPDVYVPCEVCHGKRYNRETLEVRYKGKSIADVLDMTINQAVDFFENVPQILQKIKALQNVGLGYIRLGQSSTTLSGGESQRVKLATELSKRDTGKTLYILDEPTTGLHFEDIRILMDVLQKLVDRGNTVIIIEHNLDVIKLADWLIDMGPEGGRGGGQLLFAGTPEEMVKQQKGYTYKFLAPLLKKSGKPE